MAVLLLASTVSGSSASSQELEKWARDVYANAAAHYETNRANANAAWQFARAAYQLADLLQDDHERNWIADAGIDAARQAVSLDTKSAPAHYYGALNLGESARGKKLGALKLLHEMEHELSTARRLEAAFDYGGPDRALGNLYLQAPVWPASIGNRNKARAHLKAAEEASPDYPDNHISMAEAYAQWGELRNLEAELGDLDRLLPQARARFKGENWAASWADWDMRMTKLEKAREHLAANPRVSPGERGARRVK
jgi:hypothetical protein